MNISLSFSQSRIWSKHGRLYSFLSFFIVFITAVADGKPTRFLPRHALEKFYHEMLRTPSSIESDVGPTAPQGKGANERQFRNFYKKQYSTFIAQASGMTARVLIYSIASKGYLTVDGTNIHGHGSRDSVSSVIKIESIGFGKMRLRGENSNNYICFGKEGKLIGQSSGSHQSCVFRQFALPNHYTSFQSCTKKPFWIGVRQKGIVKKGTRTKAGKRATKFIIVRL